MRTLRVIDVQCDRCSARHDAAVSTQNGARIVVTASGWRRVRDQDKKYIDLCPSCVEKHTPPKKG